MDGFLRRLLKKQLLFLALKSLKKYQTKVVIIYGWDWVEGLREEMYQLLSPRVNTRRNYDWIRWDLGLPLFILGYDQNPNQSKLKLILNSWKAFLSIIFKPQRYRNYLIISLNAKQEKTLNYWLPLIKKAEVVILPVKEGQESQLTLLKSEVNAQQLVDVRQNLQENIQVKKSENIESVMLTVLSETAKKLPILVNWKFNQTEIQEAVMKVDWQRFLWERIKLNLQKKHEI